MLESGKVRTTDTGLVSVLAEDDKPADAVTLSQALTLARRGTHEGIIRGGQIRKIRKLRPEETSPPDSRFITIVGHRTVENLADLEDGPGNGRLPMPEREVYRQAIEHKRREVIGYDHKGREMIVTERECVVRVWAFKLLRGTGI
jgi:hypothetical protein